MSHVSSRASVDPRHRFRLPGADERAVSGFKEIWQTKVGAPLTEQDASRLALQVLQLVYLQHFGTLPECNPRHLTQGGDL